tara:strand:- start:459 stop:1013 length:555 start_codon:yes stop_codon:yes gene_type:complete
MYNSSYSTSTYRKGALVLAQLKYIVGEKYFKETLLRYFEDWAFKHPTPNDFIRSAEKTSGLELDWFLTDWTQTVNTIDYAVKEVGSIGSKTEITLERVGLMPMPVEVEVLLKNGETLNYYIPLQMMRGEKPIENSVRLLGDWAWAYPTYRFTIGVPVPEIKTVTLDVKNETADVGRENNQIKLL